MAGSYGILRWGAKTFASRSVVTYTACVEEIPRT